MARKRGQRKGYLRPENGSWLLTFRVYTAEHPAGKRQTVTIGPAEGTGKLTMKQAERFAWDHYLQPLDTATVKPLSTMMVEEFWVKMYEPHLRKSRKYATQIQYVSIWKLWLLPSIGKKRLWQLEPADIDQAISSALAAGKSTATAKHIRKIASAIFTYAKRMRCASGDNPAQAVEPVAVEPVRSISSLTWEQCQRLLGALKEPARTMTLVSLSLSMNISELTGLRERHVNFSDRPQDLGNGDSVPAHSIAIREHLYHGRRGSLKTGKRKRNLPMSSAVESALAALIAGNPARSDDAPVFQTKAGTGQSADNLRKRVLVPAVKAIRSEHGPFPHVSWHVLRHTHATLTKDVGMSDYDRQRLMGHASADMTDRYTHADVERIRAGVETVSQRLTADLPGGGLVQ